VRASRRRRLYETDRQVWRSQFGAKDHSKGGASEMRAKRQPGMSALLDMFRVTHARSGSRQRPTPLGPFALFLGASHIAPQRRRTSAHEHVAHNGRIRRRHAIERSVASSLCPRSPGLSPPSLPLRLLRLLRRLLLLLLTPSGTDCWRGLRIRLPLPHRRC